MTDKFKPTDIEGLTFWWDRDRGILHGSMQDKPFVDVTEAGLIYNRALTDEEIVKIEAYLTEKYK